MSNLIKPHGSETLNPLYVMDDTERAALVMGLILGFVAILWAVLLGRFVFARKPKS